MTAIPYWALACVAALLGGLLMVAASCWGAASRELRARRASQRGIVEVVARMRRARGMAEFEAGAAELSRLVDGRSGPDAGAR